MNNQTDVSIKFKNYVEGSGKLEKYAETLGKIHSVVSAYDKGVAKQMETNASAIQNISNDIKDIRKNTDSAFNYTTIREFTRNMQRAVTAMSKMVAKSTAYLENINLYQVAFDGNYESADRFINKMAEMYGLDESWLTRTVGNFRQLANAMDLSAQTGENLSKLLTQMSLDISSLYNVDMERASSVLQSALAGQTKPIRGLTGGDITIPTLQTTLDNLGINEYVNNLSFAEKRLLIVISLTQQLSGSIGDMGRTIESPANQMRVLNSQWERLTRTMGDVFLPIVAKILPYLNAVLMVLTEITGMFATWIATLFGFDEDSFDYFTGISDGALELEESLTGASESAKKLKQGLRGFDKLNVIKTPTDNQDDKGTGGVRSSIMGAFDSAYANYQKQLDNVQMKATKIRDTIMEWLGFEKQIDEETGEISWKFEKITGGTILGALAVGGVIYSGVKTIFNLLTKIGLLKFGGVGNLIGNIFGKGGSAGTATSVATEASKNIRNFSIPKASTVIKGMADLAIIVLGSIAVVEAIGLLTKIPNFKQTATDGIKMLKEVFWGLASVAIPLAGLSVGIKLMGSVGVSTFAKGLADFAIIVGGVTATVTAIGALMAIPYFSGFASNGTKTVVDVVKGLWDIAIPIAGISVYLIAMGFASPAVILSGLGGFALILGGLTTILIALGALRQIEGFDWIVAEGKELLLGLGETIGGFAGSIVSGFVGQAFEGLEEVGTHLSNFMINARPFFEGLSLVNAESVQAVSNLASCLLKLTATEILEGLFSWATGGTSLEEFGKDIANFAPYFARYSKAIKGIDAGVVTATSKSALSIAEFAKKLPNKGGVVGWFAGENDLSDFGKMLPKFGKDMKQYSDNIRGIDTNLINNTSTAVMSIAEFADELPNQGGMVSWFTGDNTLDKFSKVLPSFGKNLKQYSDNIRGVDPTLVANTSTAVQTIVEFAENLPNQGGIVSWFTGDNTLSAFGAELKTFGEKFKGYYDKIKDISADKVDKVNSSIKSIIESLVKVKDKGLVSTVKEFGKELAGFGADVSKFLKEAFPTSDAKTIGKNFGNAFAKAMIKAIKDADFPKLSLSSGKSKVATYTIDAYADGGLPPVGQLFVANEKGAELVGHIGGQTFVANQNQMMDLLDKKIGNAQSGGNQTFIIQVGDEEVAKVVLNKVNEMAKTNGKPIKIG